MEKKALHKNNIHNGYIVKSDFANEPIKVKINNNGKDKPILNISGTDCVKRVNNIKIDMTENTMTIKDNNNTNITLKKE